MLWMLFIFMIMILMIINLIVDFNRAVNIKYDDQYFQL